MTNRIRSLVILVLTAACASGSSSGSSTSSSASASSSGGMTFAPSLGVNLAEMRETSTGLWVKDIQPGTGAPAMTGDFVRLEYVLHLADGTPIDSVMPGQKPFEFQLGQRQVIAGWEEGVTGMRAGGKRRIVVPFRLGYGIRAHNNIPGRSTLVFDMHVVYVGR